MAEIPDDDPAADAEFLDKLERVEEIDAAVAALMAFASDERMPVLARVRVSNLIRELEEEKAEELGFNQQV